MLKTEGTEEGTNELDQNIKVTFYESDNEKEMLQDAFQIIKTFPFVLTYNGDEFDLPYLYNRAERLGIKKSENPFYMMRDSATLGREFILICTKFSQTDHFKSTHLVKNIQTFL